MIRSNSKSRKACINWKRIPLAGKAAPNHYCQNPDENNLADKRFCYTSKTEREECDVPSCVWNINCFTGIGDSPLRNTARTATTGTVTSLTLTVTTLRSTAGPESGITGFVKTLKKKECLGAIRPICFVDGTIALYLDVTGTTLTFIFSEKISFVF
jgi:hypothetical protein